jgi:hypothetical protein
MAVEELRRMWVIDSEIRVQGVELTTVIKAHPPLGSGSSWQPASHALSSNLSMASTSQRPKGRDGALTTLDAFIQTFGLVKDTCGIPPAQIAFASAVVVLTIIRVHPPSSPNTMH